MISLVNKRYPNMKAAGGADGREGVSFSVSHNTPMLNFIGKACPPTMLANSSWSFVLKHTLSLFLKVIHDDTVAYR
jgi:hypothetical protein